jgi:hypothetical protein
MAAIQHMALGVAGFGCEDALVHLLNYVWPNVFETSPHVVQAFMGAIEGLRVAIGPSKILQYTLQVGTACPDVLLLFFFFLSFPKTCTNRTAGAAIHNWLHCDKRWWSVRLKYASNIWRVMKRQWERLKHYMHTCTVL